MSEKLEKIITKLEEFAPLSLCSEWDNAGWQIYLADCEIKKIMICVTASIDVIEQAVIKNCNLIISHHPLIFDKLSKINSDTPTGSIIAKAIRNDIQIYAMHTNLDSAKNGVADKLAEKLGLIEVQNYNNFVRIGVLEKEEEILSYIARVKNALNIDNIRLVNHAGIKKVKKVALCPGCGCDFIGELKEIDLFVTGDVKYHQGLSVQNFALADAGHFETERIILPYMKKLLAQFNVEVVTAEEKSPWETI
jgi:GTP cyclohydrolase I